MRNFSTYCAKMWGWGEMGRFILPYHSLSHISGHVARLDTGVPAHDALRLMMDTCEGTKPMARWRRPPGRLHNGGLNNVQEDPNAILAAVYAVEI